MVIAGGHVGAPPEIVSRRNLSRALLVSLSASPTDRLELEHMQSFVSHELFGPLAMLRNYLHVMADRHKREPGVQELVEDAEQMAGQLEARACLLRDALGLSCGHLKLEPQWFDLFEFVRHWAQGATGVVWAQSWMPSWASGGGQCTQETMSVHMDSEALGRALDYSAWQMGRMGAARGDVSVTVYSDEGRPCVILFRGDGCLEARSLKQALNPMGSESLCALRRLPACGLPLRVARGVVEAVGGKLDIRNEDSRGVALSFLFRLKDEV